MKLSEFLIVPFLLQGLLMFVDEFYFHLKRGLPRWERIGHPVDTISVLVCYACVLFLPPTTENIYLFVGLSLFSCLLVTKDEFVHQEHCEATESWIHAMLFVLHPLVFLVAGLIWWGHWNPTGAESHLWLGIQIQAALTFVFLFYQIIYWSVLSKTNPT